MQILHQENHDRGPSQCRLTMAQETSGFRHMFMGAPKSSPYVSELNKAYTNIYLKMSPY